MRNFNSTSTRALTSLPEDVFHQLAHLTGFHGSATQCEDGTLKPTFSEVSIEEFFGELIHFKLARNESYYVLTNRKGKDEVKHSFAKYSNEHGSSLTAMCFFPEMDEVSIVLPREAFESLPEKLWEPSSNLPRNRYDNDSKVKEGALVIYNESGVLNTGTVETSPLFGKPIRQKTDKFIQVTRLREWLSTKEGRKFIEEKLNETLERSCPALLRTIQRGVSIDELITELLAAHKQA
ncbi:hypothetical protein [Vibrio sp. D431a]|uniref:hypothetical protein n=1 Tax=Vibrio sp. D431a TaxID=2837388 RepID=UPI002553C914|nr:hypothetical protein [Vibrio sp. D431a]MDK9793778.1 hypothetical protein [Vibrio sp. D431a]